MDIMEKVKRLQKARGWSNAQLAKNAELPPTTIQNLYTRNNQPSFPTLQALCTAFGITIAQFFSDSNVPLDLTPEQAHLLEHWNSLTDEQKKALIALIKSI